MMKKLTQSCSKVLVVSLVFGCAAAPPPPSLKPVATARPTTKKVDYLAQAASAIENKQFDQAIVNYGQYLAKSPDSAMALYNRGTLYLKAGKVSEALADFQKAVELDPKNADAVINLGVCLREKDDLNGAVAAYRAYLKNDSFNARVLNNLSALYRSQKKFKKGISALRLLLMRDQKNVDAYKNLALIYFDQGKIKLSMTILQNAQKMSKAQSRKDPDINVNMGMIYLAKKENGKAMAQFKHAVEIEKNNLLANYNIGALALSHRDYNMAAKTLTIAIGAWPNDFEVNAALGYALQGQQKHKEAATQLEKAYAIKKDEGVLYQLVVVWQAAGDAARALTYGEQLLALQGKQCTEEDFDGFCGRYNGIKMMIAMEKENAQPPPEEDKPKTGQVDVFEEGDDDETAASGETPGAEGESLSEGAAGGADAPKPAGNQDDGAVKTSTSARAGSI
jgi:tetratricopeptide (TPR) repeat protein